MVKRRGASVYVKSVATSTLLILLIVGMFGALNVRNTGRIVDEQSLRQSDGFKTALKKRGDVQTRELAQAARNAIATNDWGNLQAFVPEIGKDDPDVAYVYVVDKD